MHTERFVLIEMDAGEPKRRFKFMETAGNRLRLLTVLATFLCSMLHSPLDYGPEFLERRLEVLMDSGISWAESYVIFWRLEAGVRRNSGLNYCIFLTLVDLEVLGQHVDSVWKLIYL